MNIVITFIVGVIAGAVATIVYRKRIQALATKAQAGVQSVESKVETVKNDLLPK